MNPWRRDALTQNPYDRTAFAVARVPPEEVARRTVVTLIGRTRRAVRTDPTAHTLQGQPVTEMEINAAEQVLLDPQRRIVEELLVHATEPPPREQVRRAARQVAAALAGGQEGPLPVTNLAALAPVAGQFARQSLADAPGPEPFFGARELALVPPFGRPEED